MPAESPPPGTGALFEAPAAVPPAVRPAAPDPALTSLAAALPERLWLGTSSWHYPGWAGLVWDKLYGEARLSREGLDAYARHPLFNAVGLDRGFYRPLSLAQYYSDYKKNRKQGIETLLNDLKDALERLMVECLQLSPPIVRPFDVGDDTV